VPEYGDIVHGIVHGDPVWAMCRGGASLPGFYRVSNIHIYPTSWNRPYPGDSIIGGAELVGMDDPEDIEYHIRRTPDFARWVRENAQATPDLVPMGDPVMAEFDRPAVDPLAGHSYTTVDHGQNQPHTLFMHPAAYARLQDAGMLPINAEVTQQVVPVADLMALHGAANDAFNAALAAIDATQNPRPRPRPARRARIRRRRRG
jgi:hypothetical protein